MMFWRVLRGSLRYQRTRLAIATMAVLLGASLISTLVNLSFSVSNEAGRELRAYGANLILLPKEELVTEVTSFLSPTTKRGIPEEHLAILDSMKEIVGYAPYLYLVATIGEQPVVVGGTQFERVRGISPWWKVKGEWPMRPEEGLVGANVAETLGLEPGDRVTMTYGESTKTLIVAGVLQTGGPEDDQILVPLKLAQALSGQLGEVSMVQVSILANQRTVDEVATNIEARLPDVDARALRKIAQAEARILSRIRRLMTLVAALVLAVATLTVGSTLNTAVLERRTEIGLMKALGADDRRVVAFFLAEALSMGLVGGLVGYVIGLGMAALIGRQVFHATLSPTLIGLPATLSVAAGVVILASLWAVHQVLTVDPATTLKGE